MLPLPTPQRDGCIDELRGFLNVDEESWRLIVAWLVGAVRPIGPYPVLALSAEQGSGKSTAARLLRALIDPNAAPLRAEPRDSRDLMIAASNSWCLVYDNLSSIPPWLSNAFCRLSTGGGFATRQLHTDCDEILFDAQRPILLTSIEDVATRSDLLDRCLVVSLPTILDERRSTEAELFGKFESARARILGGLLDVTSEASRLLPKVTLDNPPRMADFAVWVCAAEPALGWTSGAFLTTYQGNRQSANDIALEASSLARVLFGLLEARGSWTGTATELLDTLDAEVGEQAKRHKTWPKNPRSMAGHLRRLAPNLRAAGWCVIFPPRQARKRLITIEPTAPSVASRPSSVASLDAECKVAHAAAKTSKLFIGDDSDANDAIAGPFFGHKGQNSSDIEQGEL
jgi:hypothetical protein